MTNEVGSPSPRRLEDYHSLRASLQAAEQRAGEAEDARMVLEGSVVSGEHPIVAALRQQVASLTEQLKGAKKDGELLDWAAGRFGRIVDEYEKTCGHPSLRQLIRAAMSRGQEGGT